MAIKRRLEASKAIRMTEEIQARVTQYLNQEWSPKQIFEEFLEAAKKPQVNYALSLEINIEI